MFFPQLGIADATFRTLDKILEFSGVLQNTDPADITATSGQDVDGVDFGNFELISISGVKFNDLNGDGDQDSGEPVLPGWTIELDVNADGTEFILMRHPDITAAARADDLLEDRGNYWPTFFAELQDVELDGNRAYVFGVGDIAYDPDELTDEAIAEARRKGGEERALVVVGRADLDRRGTGPGQDIEDRHPRSRRHPLDAGDAGRRLRDQRTHRRPGEAQVLSWRRDGQRHHGDA